MINLKLEVMLTARLGGTPRQMLALPARIDEKTLSSFSPQCWAGGRTSGDTTNYKDHSGLFPYVSYMCKDILLIRSK